MATQEFWTDLSLKQNQLKDAVIEVVSVEPGTTTDKAGRIVSYQGMLYVSDGTNYVKLAKNADVTAVKTTADANKEAIGDESHGLIKAVADIKKTLGGDGSGDENLTTLVAGLRTDLGTKDDEASATGSAFARIAKNVADIAANATAASDAQKAADKAQKDATAAGSKASANETAIGTLQDKVKTNSDDITSLKTTVGDASIGLVQKVAKNTSDITALTTTVGTNKTDLEAEIAKKVDKVTGKGLSTEDYTTADKTKLGGIDEGAQVNVIDTVKVDGSALAVDGKAVNIDLSGYAKKSDISSAYKFEGSVAFAALPSNLGADDKGKVYNVTDAFVDGIKTYPAGTNVAWTGTSWDPLAGYTDFSIYAEKTDVTTELAKKQNNLSEAQLAAANSGITAAKVGTYDGYSALITAAQEAADAAQGTADKAVVANAAITSATKCKITYDSKGLVTGGADLEAADIPSIPVTKVTGTLPYAQSPIMAAQFDVTATAGIAFNVSTGMTTALVAQALDSNNNVVFCQTTITGGTVTLTFNEAFTGKVNVVGLR